MNEDHPHNQIYEAEGSEERNHRKRKVGEELQGIYGISQSSALCKDVNENDDIEFCEGCNHTWRRVDQQLKNLTEKVTHLAADIEDLKNKTSLMIKQLQVSTEAIYHNTNAVSGPDYGSGNENGQTPFGSIATFTSSSSQVVKPKRAEWNEELTRAFVVAYVNEFRDEESSLPPSEKNIRWENTIKAFNGKTGNNYGRSHLKNRKDTLRKEWKLWIQLRKDRKWSDTKKTIDADEDWWVRKIKENKKFEIFKHKGFDPELEKMLHRMYYDIVA